MFLTTTSHITINQGIQEKNQHSKKTISKYFYKILNAFILIYAQYIQLLFIIY